MYNPSPDELICKETSPAPTEPMFAVIQVNYDLAMKIRELIQHINGQLYGDPYNDETGKPCNCAFDTILETRRLLESAAGTLNDIRSRMEG